MREFSDVEFSSFAHLIGFTQSINRSLNFRQFNDIENAKAMCANADTAVTAWCSLLPVSKRRILREDGSVDELLFKANILMHVYVQPYAIIFAANYLIFLDMWWISTASCLA